MLNHTVSHRRRDRRARPHPGRFRLAAGKTETLRFFSKTDQLQLTHADGTVVDNLTGPPVAGDRLEIYASDFAGDHKRTPRSRPRPSTRSACSDRRRSPTAPPTSRSAARCSSSTATRLIGGAGKYLKATGRVISNKTVGDSNDSDIVAKIKVR